MSVVMAFHMKIPMADCLSSIRHDLIHFLRIFYMFIIDLSGRWSFPTVLSYSWRASHKWSHTWGKMSRRLSFNNSSPPMKFMVKRSFIIEYGCHPWPTHLCLWQPY